MLLFPHAFRRCAGFIAAVAIGISGSMAIAQEGEIISPVPVPGQVTSSPEVVIITPPYGGPMRSTIGAPILDVSLSARVRTNDLNPLSVSDWIELQHRVRDTARQLCRRLNVRHPIGTPDEFRCARRAIEDASSQIDAAIRSGGRAPGMENP